jgi:hypothetical protein
MAHAYRAADVRQINPSDPWGRYNCTAYSLARLLDYATLGGLVGVSGGLVRALSDEPTPDKGSPGLNIPQMVAVAHRLHVELVDRTGAGWAALMRYLQERRAILLQLDAFQYPPELQTYRIAVDPFPHAVALEWITSAGISLYDPMVGKERYVTEAQIKPAALALYPRVRFATTRVVPWLA